MEQQMVTEIGAPRSDPAAPRLSRNQRRIRIFVAFEARWRESIARAK
jgi:hypothetical protein